MSSLDPHGGQVEPGRSGPGDAHRHRIPRLLHRGEPEDEGRRQVRSPSPPTPPSSAASYWCSASIGFLALWKRKRTLLAFVLFLIGFALTQFIQLFGFAYIFLGGFLLLRAWRLNKYGTTDSKVIRREAAARPRGRQRKEAAAATSSKTASAPGARKPPTASKRYTPKAAPRKKIPKADRVSPGTVGRARDAAGSNPSVSPPTQSATPNGATRSASVRRRTSERAVGSSPSARSTSTSVTIPITVE